MLLQLSNDTNKKIQAEPIEEWVFETRLLPQEVLEEEIIEHVEHRTVVEERQVPQVKSLYPFSGQGMTMSKGEVFEMLKIIFTPSPLKNNFILNPCVL